MFRRQSPSDSSFPFRPLGADSRSDEKDAWATDDDFPTFEEGADRLMAPGLSAEEKERLVREQIPAALNGLATAATSPDLSAEERGNMARVAATLGGDLTSALEGAQLAPWEKASMQETARLLSGRGPVGFTFDPQQGNSGEAAMSRGVANVKLNPADFVSADGVVDVDKLKAVLAHEGRHIYDQRALGFTDRTDPAKTFTSLDQYRWTDQKAYRNEAALDKAIGRQDPDGITADTADSWAEDVVRRLRPQVPNFRDYGSGKGGEKSWKW